MIYQKVFHKKSGTNNIFLSVNLVPFLESEVEELELFMYHHRHKSHTRCPHSEGSVVGMWLMRAVDGWACH